LPRNIDLNFEEMLDFICQGFGLPIEPHVGRVQKIPALNDFLLPRLLGGGTGGLLIATAQSVDDKVAENLRLWLNLETPQKKLLQIVLAGQPELEQKLAQLHLRQLKQRVT